MAILIAALFASFGYAIIQPPEVKQTIPDAHMPEENISHWWGTYNLNIDERKAWQIGPLSLWIQRRRNDWQIAYQETETTDTNWRLDDRIVDELSWPDATIQRFVYHETHSRLTLRPVLADRSVVVRPINPFFIPPKQSVTLYVSTPVWIEIYVHDETNPLCDFPVQRPSDTWFGPTTMEGELCYAGKTHGRLRMEEIVYYAFRAVTPLQIENQAHDKLAMDRVNVPVSYLPLHGNVHGQLWTPMVKLTRNEDAETAEMTISKTVPSAAGKVQLLTPARKEATRNRLSRTLSALFG